ncbi:DUF1905 domain-containing protein [Agromyces atrinae]|uniref:DUF1905 domain-containing protein n=1 Tax=Agromyces atrinae TaxID=592376 RepID=A0A4Q2MD39_9MICO|nr:DUF1905 domain-containing protein [Agromyces atrinae]NYD67148.1 hypothetical protein [Agromyces atrinae]RXZ87010.1 DUF1905 domain-containing protein [Agromyces atrinae]
MDLEFTGPVWYWRGPAPFHFVTVPVDEADSIGEVAAHVTYGWGMVPVTVTIGVTSWSTSLWPKDDGYIVPLKADVRRAESIELDDVVTVRLGIGV